MNNLLILILFAIMAVNCNFKNSIDKSSNKKNDDIKNVEIVTYPSICGQFFLHNKDTMLTLFDDVTGYLVMNDAPLLPYVNVINDDKSELLRLFYYPGDAYNDFSYFEISYLKNSFIEGSKFISSNCKKFVTENKIELGVTKNYLIQIKGQKYKSEIKEGYECLSYIGPDLYKEEYFFNNSSQLVKFGFGDLYP